MILYLEMLSRSHISSNKVVVEVDRVPGSPDPVYPEAPILSDFVPHFVEG